MTVNKIKSNIFKTAEVRFAAKLIALTILPLVIINLYILYMAGYDAKYLIFENQIDKKQIFTGILQNKIGELIRKSSGNVNRVSFEMLPKALQNVMQTEKPEYYTTQANKNLFLFKPDYIDLTALVFDMSKLYDFILQTDAIDTNETLFIFNTDGTPAFSSLIETEFSVPAEWQETLSQNSAQSGRVKSSRIISVQNKSYLLTKTALPEFNLLLFSVKPEELLLESVNMTLSRQLFILIIIILSVCIITYILSKSGHRILYDIERQLRNLFNEGYRTIEYVHHSGISERILKNIHVIKSTINENDYDRVKNRLQQQTMLLTLVDQLGIGMSVFETNQYLNFCNDFFNRFLQKHFSGKPATFLEHIDFSNLITLKHNQNTQLYLYIQNKGRVIEYYEVHINLMIAENQNQEHKLLVVVSNATDYVSSLQNHIHSREIINKISADQKRISHWLRDEVYFELHSLLLAGSLTSPLLHKLRYSCEALLYGDDSSASFDSSYLTKPNIAVENLERSLQEMLKSLENEFQIKIETGFNFSEIPEKTHSNIIKAIQFLIAGLYYPGCDVQLFLKNVQEEKTGYLAGDIFVDFKKDIPERHLQKIQRFIQKPESRTGDLFCHIFNKQMLISNGEYSCFFDKKSAEMSMHIKWPTGSS